MTDSSIEDFLSRIEDQQENIDWDTVLEDLRSTPRYSNVKIEKEEGE